jgi:hypothetical protein
MNGLEVCIAEPDNTISLEGNVETYSVQNPFIIGYASTNHMHANQGYFIINTRTHEMKQGLSEADWKNELKAVPWLSLKLERVP